MSRSASDPLRLLTAEEKQELQHVSRATSETHIRHQRAVALLAVAEGKSLSEAARLVGWKSHNPVTKVTRRFNSMGVCALSDLPRPGPYRTYGPAQQAGAALAVPGSRPLAHTDRSDQDLPSSQKLTK